VFDFFFFIFSNVLQKVININLYKARNPQKLLCLKGRGFDQLGPQITLTT